MNGWGQIWEQVEAFRARYLIGDLALLPVDVFTLAELELKLDVIPFDDLFEKYSMDAALIVDFSGFYVDSEAYQVWEKGPIWKQRRLRFSVAHELGHYVMHRDIAAGLDFRSLDDFAVWTRGYHGNKYTIEEAANEFAGRLLVPADRLRSEFDQFVEKVRPIIPNWAVSGDLRRGFADSVTSAFAVNSQVIETRLDREGIWPTG